MARTANAEAGLDEALDEAVAQGILSPEKAAEIREVSPFERMRRVVEHLPREDRESARKAVVAEHYRHLVRRHLIDLPVRDLKVAGLPSLGAAADAPEPFLPGAASPWSPGDDPAAIDWPATLAAGPDLGAAAPRRRELEPDEDPAPSPTRRGRGEAPRVEIYLDTSWSMPHPEEGLNAMTLAALILATAATRQGGQVRAILFSENYMVSDWLGDEKAALDFLCGTYLGGTVFPFELLAEHAREEPGIVRVILSDGDFFWTYPSHKDSFAAAVAASDPLVATLLGCDPANVRAQFATLLSTGHFGFVPVAGAGDFAGVSASLARVLFRRRR